MGQRSALYNVQGQLKRIAKVRGGRAMGWEEALSEMRYIASEWIELPFAYENLDLKALFVLCMVVLALQYFCPRLVLITSRSY